MHCTVVRYCFLCNAVIRSPTRIHVLDKHSIHYSVFSVGLYVITKEETEAN